MLFPRTANVQCAAAVDHSDLDLTASFRASIASGQPKRRPMMGARFAADQATTRNREARHSPRAEIPPTILAQGIIPAARAGA